MVSADLLERQIAAYMKQFQLSKRTVNWLTAEYRARRALPHDEIRRVRREIERWRRLYVAEEIDDARYEREIEPLKRALSELETGPSEIKVEELASYLRTFGELFERTNPGEQRRFVTEVFDQLVVDGDQLLELRPKSKYAELFIADRHERFGGEMVVIWLPGQDSNLQPIG